jgi:hypothetical protein
MVAACSKVRFGRFGSEEILWDRDVLRECTCTNESEDSLTGLPLRDTGADRLHLSGDVATEDGVLGLAEAGSSKAGDVRQATHEVPVPGIGGARTDANQDFACSGARLGNVAELEDVGRTEDGLCDRLHVKAPLRIAAGHY